MIKKIILILFIISFTPLCYAQVSEIEGLSKPYLNQQLRQTKRRLNAIENYTINSLSGILDLDSGGTGADFSGTTIGYILYFSATGVLTALAPDNGKFLRSNGAASPTYETISLVITDTFGAGDKLLASADTEQNVQSTPYVLVKEIEIPKGIAGEFRIKFDLRGTGTRTAYGRIYRNGGAVGTEQSRLSDWVTYSEDIAGWSEGDLIQIYSKTQDGGGVNPAIRNFRIYADEPHVFTVNTD